VSDLVREHREIEGRVRGDARILVCDLCGAVTGSAVLGAYDLAAKASQDGWLVVPARGWRFLLCGDCGRVGEALLVFGVALSPADPPAPPEGTDQGSSGEGMDPHWRFRIHKPEGS
jgi:hypothetical protein